MYPLETNADVPKSNGSSVSDFHSDPRWSLVERVLLSAPFQKSSNLYALLSYLAEYSIQGRADALTERQIGIAVFGKPAGYSPAEDSAVRVHVRQLRLRLHEFFDQEGRSEPLRMEIPKGSYVLGFHESQPEFGPRPVPMPQPAPGPVPAPTSHKRQFLFWAAIAAALVCAIGWYHTARSIARPQVPWPLNAVIQPDQQTHVIVSDSSLMLRQLGQHQTTLQDYLRPDFRKSLIPPHLPENFNRLLIYVADSQLTSFADLTTVFTMQKVAGPLGSQLVITSARDLDRRNLEQGNYVFVGSATSNPWVSLYDARLNFEEVEESVGGRMYFRNRNPLPGEQKEYDALSSTGSTGVDYATISLLPGEMGRGNVMLLQGLRQEGTEALSVLLADTAHLQKLENAVQRDSKSPSPYFEALVRSQAVAGAPVSLSIVAVRSIQP